MRLFGRMTGVLDRERYAKRLCDFVLNLLTSLFPRFTAATLRVRKEHDSFVSLKSALDAIVRAARPHRSGTVCMG